MDINNKVLLENSKLLTVLYVEDDASLRDATLKLFEDFFLSVDIAEDGEKGLAKYTARIKNKQRAYDIVITDITMPNMNGIEMSEKIKNINREQAVILVTAFNEVEYLNNAIAIGVNGFLTKPMDIKNLKNVLYPVTQMLVDRKLVKQHYEQIEELNMLIIDKKDARNLNSSKDILVDLESNKDNISRIWTGKEAVHERLERHLIDVEFFRKHYAVKVIDYFLGVIKGENELGNCPVIFIMLDFLKNKDLPLTDIFIVCVAFKNTVCSYVFDRYTFNSRLYDDFSVVLDRNFEGVILNYLEMNYTKNATSIEKSDKSKNLENLEVVAEDVSKVESINYTEFILEHDIYELEDLEEDIDTLAISITENTNKNLHNYVELGNNIQKYGNILRNYPMFSALGSSILKLGLNFTENAQLLFDERERMMNISALIEGFVNDLIVWRKEIFENNIQDPHFLDQSFFSNVDTIIMFI